MPSGNIDHATLRAWLTFANSPQLGGLASARLLSRFGSLEAIFSASDQVLAACGLPAAKVRAVRNLESLVSGAGPADTDHLVAWGEQQGHAILTPLHAEYPRPLKQIAVPPPVLYRIGQPIPDVPAIAIVGARKATAAGCATARELGAQISGHGVAVVSGLAAGIDAAAHKGALEAPGSTIAVLGCGPDIVYPRSNAALYQKIKEVGCILSEFRPGVSPRKHHFPQRNRIISGLALGTVVVEAGLRSGSLSTARHALEQGREVFAVPGSVHSENSRGPHQLLRDGAQLVETCEDVLGNLPDWCVEEVSLSGASAKHSYGARADVPLELRPVWEQLDFHPLPVDELIARIGMAPSRVTAALSELEIDGLVRLEGCGYSRVP